MQRTGATIRLMVAGERRIVFCGFSAYHNGAVYDGFPVRYDEVYDGALELDIEIPNSTYVCWYFNIPEYDTSITRLKDVDERRPDGPLTAEALYWLGITEYFRQGRSSAASNAVWKGLIERFPESIWSKRVP